MKAQLFLFTFLSILLSGTVMAQDSISNKNAYSWPAAKFKTSFQLKKPETNKNRYSHAGKPDSALAFHYHLSDTVKRTAIKVNNKEPLFHSNMPVLKPKNTSKVLLAELNPDFPYEYKMPVRKIKEKLETGD